MDNIIKQQYNNLPDEVKKAIDSSDLPIKFNNIAKKYNLNIEQNGQLQTETILVMLGLESSSDFVKNLKENLSIDSILANKIAGDINADILNSIKSFLQKFESENETNETVEDLNTDNIVFNEPETPKTPTPIYSTPIKKPNPVVTSIPTYTTPPEIAKDIPNIEKVGDFTIEKESVPAQNIEINKDEILKGIEEPENIPSVSMTDHLLSTSVNNKEEVIEKKIEVKEKLEKNTDIKIDPYREQI